MCDKCVCHMQDVSQKMLRSRSHHSPHTNMVTQLSFVSCVLCKKFFRRQKFKLKHFIWSIQAVSMNLPVSSVVSLGSLSVWNQLDGAPPSTDLLVILYGKCLSILFSCMPMKNHQGSNQPSPNESSVCPRRAYPLHLWPRSCKGLKLLQYQTALTSHLSCPRHDQMPTKHRQPSDVVGVTESLPGLNIRTWTRGYFRRMTYH